MEDMVRHGQGKGIPAEPWMAPALFLRLSPLRWHSSARASSLSQLPPSLQYQNRHCETRQDTIPERALSFLSLLFPLSPSALAFGFAFASTSIIHHSCSHTRCALLLSTFSWSVSKCSFHPLSSFSHHLCSSSSTSSIGRLCTQSSTSAPSRVKLSS